MHRKKAGGNIWYWDRAATQVTLSWLHVKINLYYGSNDLFELQLAASRCVLFHCLWSCQITDLSLFVRPAMTMSGPGATQDIANRIAVTRSYVLTACLLAWVVFLVCCLCWSHPKPEAARARIAELQANLTKTAGEPPVAGQRQTSLAHISCKPKNPIYRIDKAPNRSKCLVHII